MRRQSRSSLLYSSAVHALVLAALVVTIRHSPRIAPARLPGTRHGVRLLTYDSRGGTPTPPASTPLQRLSPSLPTFAPSHTVQHVKTETVAAPKTDPGDSTSGSSSLGQGNINIALQKFFPPPRPDLSTLPAGSAGDVIVDATIDTQGNITQLMIVHGLTDPINNAVLATVRQWTYTPATRDGIPIPSEQELLFHFSRG